VTQPFTDGLSEIIRGSRPLNDLKHAVADWRSGGGDKIRDEFQQALAGGR